MENQRLDELLEKYILKTATVEEQHELLDWYIDQNDGDVIWTADQLNEDVLVKKRLLQNINARTQSGWKRVKLWPRIAVAAAAVAAIVFGIWFFNSRYDMNAEPGAEITKVNDIAPGKNGATITLSNGKVIQLSDAKTGVVIGDDLKYSDGSPLSPQGGSLPEGERSEALTASTAKGQTYQFTLPDGTKVWLNADSKISFPSQFSGKERKILLDGEAYFEVVHNAKQPFRVESEGQVVEDIGTAFNINAYDDEGSTKTTLIEGSASVNKIVLKPNQQSVLTGNNQIKVTNVDAELAVAWKNNEFMFESQSIEHIMKMVERWYDVEVIYRGEKPVEKYSGSVSRFDNVSKVLRILESSGAVHFKIEGRKIFVSP